MTRRTAVVLVAVAALAILLFTGALAVGGGGGDTAARHAREERWRARLAKLSSPVDPRTLEAAGDCQYAASTGTLVVQGVCVITVPSAGANPLDASRKLSFHTGEGSLLSMTATVRGHRIQKDLEPDADGDLGLGAGEQQVTFSRKDLLTQPPTLVFTR